MTANNWIHLGILIFLLGLVVTIIVVTLWAISQPNRRRRK